MTRFVRPLLACILSFGLLLGGLVPVGTAAETTRSPRVHAASGPSKPSVASRHARRAREANALGQRLLEADDHARSRFERQHPGLLPEGKLSIPSPDASHFDWSELGMVGRLHRQRTGDCWANAAIEALECSYRIRNAQQLVLSPQPVLDHLKYGVENIAGNSAMALDYLFRAGTAQTSEYPYDGKPKIPRNMALPYRAATQFAATTIAAAPAVAVSMPGHR